jgi:hypothetical protein
LRGKDCFARILDQCVQAFDELVGIERLVNDHPTHLALVGHRGHHGEFLPGASYSHGDRCVARWRKASAAHIGVDQIRLVSPVNLGPFSPGA